MLKTLRVAGPHPAVSALFFSNMRSAGRFCVLHRSPLCVPPASLVRSAGLSCALRRSPFFFSAPPAPASPSSSFLHPCSSCHPPHCLFVPPSPPLLLAPFRVPSRPGTFILLCALPKCASSCPFRAPFPPPRYIFFCYRTNGIRNISVNLSRKNPQSNRFQLKYLKINSYDFD